MNPFKFFKKSKEDISEPAVEEVSEYDDDEINIGTKVKIIAAMLVVAVATYVALWVQEPADLKIDVISGTSTQETMQAVSPQKEMQTVQYSATETSAYPVLAEVSITDFTFTPANLTVKRGTTVVWTNMDPVDHTVTADTFSSSALESGDSFTYTFDAVGEYPYECAFHPQMTGRIIVTDEPVEAVETESYASILEEDSPRPYEDLYGALSTADDFQSETAPGADLLTVSSPPATESRVEERTADMPLIVTFDPDELMAAGDAGLQASEAIQESDALTKSGPEHVLYVVVFAAILFFNRRKLAGVLS